MSQQIFEKQLQELNKKLSTQNIKHEKEEQLNKQAIEQLKSQLEEKEEKNERLKSDMQKVMEALQVVQGKEGKGGEILSLLVKFSELFIIYLMFKNIFFFILFYFILFCGLIKGR